MQTGELNYFESQEEFRNWLRSHHDKRTEVWIGFYKVGSAKKGITYKQAVDEALCFGWIDGIVKKIDAHSYCHRFTPRKKSSTWSQVNIRRYCELLELGLVHSAGQNVFENRDLKKEKRYSFEQEKHELPAAFEKKFKANKKAWKHFMERPASYRKPAIWWVISAKQEATRIKRLQTLIEDSENGRKIKLLRRTGE